MLANTVDYDFRFNKAYYVVNLAQAPVQQQEAQADPVAARAASLREEASRGAAPPARADAEEAQ